MGGFKPRPPPVNLGATLRCRGILSVMEKRDKISRRASTNRFEGFGEEIWTLF